MTSELQEENKLLPEIVSFIKQKDYKAIKWLGNGAFGLTVLLEDETLNEKFVCKKYAPQEGIDKEKYYKNFVNEIKLMYKLHHNNVVRVFNYYMYEEKHLGYVLMEYINGVAINVFLSQHPEMINDIFEQVIEGFAYLEHKKILHRDIRQTNILIDNGGFAKIIDFGFGKQVVDINDFNRSFSDLNWWCPIPDDFKDKIYNFKTEIYFVGKLFEKIIRDNEISGFNYDILLSEMCKVNPYHRISSFDLIKRNIQSNELINELFDYNEVTIYRNFSSSISNLIVGIYEGTKYCNDIEIIQKGLSDLYKNVMLERYLPNNTSILEIFFDGSYRYSKVNCLETSTLKDFLCFLRSCSKDKKNIVLNNLHSKFDSIERLEVGFIPDADIPF